MRGEKLEPQTQVPEGSALPTIARYRILAQLGTGGMAHVYLAVMRGDRGFNKLLVLKVPRDYVASDPLLLEMFMDEARLAARLNHPNVVQTYEVINDDGRDIIVMEYLDGYTLHELLVRARKAGTPLPTWMYLQILSHALTGLHYAHEAKDFDGKPLGLVHRDVSPHNIFVTFDGQVKVLDFGIAKASTSTHHTDAGTFKGKVRYMPYEQLASEPIDRRADIYAVGCIVWEAAVGERLWKNTPDVEVIRRVLDGQIPMPRDVDASISAELNSLCRRALARNKDERYSTCLELQNDLEQYLGTLPDRGHFRRVVEFMEQLFADDRVARQKLIERQLSRAEIFTTGQFDLPPAPSGIPVLGEGRSGSDSASGERPANGGTRIDREGSLARREKRSRRRTLWLALAGVGAFLAVPLLLMRQHAPSAATPAAAIVAPELVTLRLSSDPPSARLFFDDAPLADNPSAKAIRKDGATHILRSEAPGYITRRQAIVVDGDKAVTLTMEKEAPVAAASSAAIPREVPSAPRLTAAALPPAKSHKSPGTISSAPAAEAAGPPGFLSIDTYPWTRVSEGGTLLGQTPLVHVTLPPGEHTLSLENADQNVRQTLTVTIKSGETYSRRLAFH